MRRFFLSLLIGLTFLRGMVGDVMAVQMMSMPHEAATNAIHSVADPAHSVGEMTDFHLEKQLKMPCHEAMNEPASDGERLDGDCEQACNSCQVCHLPACLPNLPFASAIYSAAHLKTPFLSSWISADIAQFAKPPKS